MEIIYNRAIYDKNLTIIIDKYLTINYNIDIIRVIENIFEEGTKNILGSDGLFIINWEY